MKFNYTGHQKLWRWLAENPDKGKDDYSYSDGRKEGMIEGILFAQTMFERMWKNESKRSY